MTDWGQALLASLSGALALFFGAIPKILGFIIILIVGWIIASLIEKAIAALLRTVNFNGLAERSGFTGFVKKSGAGTDAAGLIGAIGKWFVRLIALVVAFDALGLPAVSDVLRQLLLWLPNLVVALVALIIGGIAAGALSRIVRGAAAEAGLGNPDLLARIASIAVWTFAVIIAVNQIGIATTLVNTLFTAAIGAIALALGLAFGLGGRDTAGEIVRSWYLKGKENAPRIEEGTDKAIGMAQRGDVRTTPPGTGKL